MVIAMISIACPVWLSVVPAKTETRSGYPIATASEEFLVRLRYWLVSGGRITRIACGTTISRKVDPRCSPSDEPASICPLCTDWMPARTISAMKAAV